MLVSINHLQIKSYNLTFNSFNFSESSFAFLLTLLISNCLKNYKSIQVHRICDLSILQIKIDIKLTNLQFVRFSRLIHLIVDAL